MGFGDVAHTFVRREPGVGEGQLPGHTAVEPAAPRVPAWDSGVTSVDHLAVALESGQLTPIAMFYQEVLGLRVIHTERIEVGAQAMESTVVQSPSRGFTITLLEQDNRLASGQIDEFVKAHGGPGVQHIALATPDAVSSVEAMVAHGVEFLTTPAAYYGLLPSRLELSRHEVEDLQRLNLLVDKDHDGQLFQIFARSTHPRKTFFFEVIERLGSKGFGSGNIQALYTALQQESEDEG
jgi:4-hydroxymandelate synthase